MYASRSYISVCELCGLKVCCNELLTASIIHALFVKVVTEVEIVFADVAFVATNSGPCCFAFQKALAPITSNFVSLLGQLITNEFVPLEGATRYHISVRPQSLALGSQLFPESIAPAFVRLVPLYVMLLTSQSVGPGLPAVTPLFSQCTPTTNIRCGFVPTVTLKL